MTPKLRLQLVTLGSLHGYFFEGIDHAHQWFQQPYVKAHPDEYQVDLVRMKKDEPCPHCGKPMGDVADAIVRRFSVEEFLKISKETLERYANAASIGENIRMEMLAGDKTMQMWDDNDEKL